MVNLRLLRGTDEVATATGFDGEIVTFVLATPYVIPKGQTKSFYVHSDIDGGRTTDTVQLYLDEDTDLTVIDQQYGYGAVVGNVCTAANPNALKPVAAPCVGVAATNLKGGTVTVTDNGPAGHQIAQNTTNVQLLNYSITAGRDLTVKNMDLTIDLSTAGTAGTHPNVSVLGSGTATVVGTSTTRNVCITAPVAGLLIDDMLSIPTGTGTVYAIVTNVDAGGVLCAGATNYFVTNVPVASAVAVAAGTVQEVNPYTLVKNVKVVDLDSGSTLQGPMTKASDGTILAGVVDHNYTKTMPEDYELVGGEARHLSVQVDIDQNLAAGYKLGATISYAVAGYIKDMAANENVALADLVGGALTSKLMSTAANSLGVTRATTPTSQIYVKGEDKVPALGMSFTAGDAGEITIKKLNVRLYGNDATVGAAPLGWPVAAGTNPWSHALGNLAANTLVSSVTLYNGNDVVAGPVTLTLVDTALPAGYTVNADHYKALFDNLSIKVAKGSTLTLVAKAKMIEQHECQYIFGYGYGSCG